MSDPDLAVLRQHMVVRLELLPLAYADMPLPNGYGKTISQPFIVALMTEPAVDARHRLARHGCTNVLPVRFPPLEESG
jgi:protein-L-isoaspartate O-methyltransferase